MDDVLSSAPLFAALDAEAAAALRASMETTRVAKGDVLFLEGQLGDRMYIITEGKIKLGHTAPDGRESILAVLGPGELLGELSLFDPGKKIKSEKKKKLKKKKDNVGKRRLRDDLCKQIKDEERLKIKPKN